MRGSRQWGDIERGMEELRLLLQRLSDGADKSRVIMCEMQTNVAKARRAQARIRYRQRRKRPPRKRPCIGSGCRRRTGGVQRLDEANPFVRLSRGIVFVGQRTRALCRGPSAGLCGARCAYGRHERVGGSESLEACQPRHSVDSDFRSRRSRCACSREA